MNVFSNTAFAEAKVSSCQTAYESKLSNHFIKIKLFIYINSTIICRHFCLLTISTFVYTKAIIYMIGINICVA